MNNRKKTVADTIHVGDWWIKGNKNKRAKGILYLPAEGEFKLEVHGNLGKPGVSNPRVIFGSTRNGKDFTLFNNASSDFIMGFGGYFRAFAPQIVLENAHVADLSKQMFTELVVDFTHLEEWCAEQTIFGDALLSDEYKVVRQEYRAVPLSGQTIHLASIKTDLVISHRIQPEYEKYRELKLTDTVLLKFTVKSAKSFEWFEKLIEKFQSMLAFFTGKPVYPQRIILKSKATKNKKKAVPPNQVTVYFGQSEKSLDESFDDKQVFVPYRAIAANAGQVIDKFLTDYDALKPVVDLFLGNIYQPPFLAQNRFINLIQAVEIFLRRRRPGSYLTGEVLKEFTSKLKKSYKTICAELTKDLNDSKIVSPDLAEDLDGLKNLRERLNGGLPYINEKSLRSRIKEAFGSLSAGECDLISDNTQKLISRAVDTRNYLTHFSEELQAKSLTGLELYKASEGLKILIILLMLDELGIEEATRIKLIKENPALQYKQSYALKFD